MFVTSGVGEGLLDFGLVTADGGLKLDLAMRLNVLAMFAALLFVGAILLGAF
jgi:hypothetical protein